MLRNPLLVRVPRARPAQGSTAALRALVPAFLVVLLAIFAPVFWAVHEATGSGFAPPEVWMRVLAKVWPWSLAILLVGAAWAWSILHAVDAWCARREEARHLGEELARAELDALRARLQPHFLFNCLHTVGSLVRGGDDRAALEALDRLGSLLRRSLVRNNSACVTLREELEFVRDYVALQRLRYGDRLEFLEDIDPDCLDQPLPTLTLQLLVENAARHGALRYEGRGRIRVVARPGDTCTLLEVLNDGHAGPHDDNRGFGIGLRAIEERLHELVDPRCRLELNELGGETLARILVPRAKPKEEAA